MTSKTIELPLNELTIIKDTINALQKQIESTRDEMAVMKLNNQILEDVLSKAIQNLRIEMVSQIHKNLVDR